MNTERLTDRSCRILAFAESEAKKLASTAIEPEHILLAMAIEEGGIAGHVLREFGVSAQAIRVAISPMQSSLNDQASLPQWSELSERAVERSHQEAVLLNHHYPGTEHLILAVVNLQAGRIPELLQKFGITPLQVREAVYAILGYGMAEDGSPIEL